MIDLIHDNLAILGDDPYIHEIPADTDSAAPAPLS